MYTQNETGTKRIVDNILFYGFSHGLHAFTQTQEGFLNNLHIEGNTIFNSGIASGVSGATRNILVGGGGGRVAQNPTIVRNCTYFTPGLGGRTTSVTRPARRTSPAPGTTSPATLPSTWSTARTFP